MFLGLSCMHHLLQNELKKFSGLVRYAIWLVVEFGTPHKNQAGQGCKMLVELAHALLWPGHTAQPTPDN